jgi:hypothetical protein
VHLPPLREGPVDSWFGSEATQVEAMCLPVQVLLRVFPNVGKMSGISTCGKCLALEDLDLDIGSLCHAQITNPEPRFTEPTDRPSDGALREFFGVIRAARNVAAWLVVALRRSYVAGMSNCDVTIGQHATLFTALNTKFFGSDTHREPCAQIESRPERHDGLNSSANTQSGPHRASFRHRLLP